MTDLVITEPAKPSLKPVYSANDMIEFHKDVTTLITKALEFGKDYGTVQGISKPFLFKSGAERLCKAFGAAASYDIVDKEVDHEASLDISTKYGEKTVKGYYSYTVKCTLRNQNDHIIADGIGLCSTREKKFQHAPHDQQNTVLKMAQKRAMVAATLNAFGLSDRFSQDEDTIDTVSKPVAAVKKEASKGYDPQDKKHQDFLLKELETRQIPAEHWDTIGNKLAGKSFTDIQAIIEEVVK